MTKHTITIENLDDFEAEHIASIFSEYRAKILVNKIEALSERKTGFIDWYDEHLAWHEEIMKKVKWTKK